METRANYVLIGAFVLMAAVALMLFTVWVTRAPFNRDFNTYDVVFEGPVNGLSEGGEVRFNGIKVGEVQRLSLDREDPNRVIARVRVAAETPVRTDSVAQLDFLGITGVTFIQIRAGSAEQPLLLSVSGEPPILPTERTALDELFSGGQDAVTVTTESLNKINAVLSDEDLESLTGMLNNLEVITGKLSADGGVIDSANSALISIDKAAIAVEKAALGVDLAAQDVGKIVRDIQPATESLGPIMADAQVAMESLREVAVSLDEGIAPMATQTLEQFSLVATDLGAMMARLQVLAAEIEQDPSRFVVQRPQPVE